MNELIGLGYIGIAASNLDRWEKFGVEVLGLQLADKAAGKRLTFRMDERAARIVVEAGSADDLAFAGWEVAGNDALNVVWSRLAKAGYDVTEGSGERVAERGVTRLISCTNPNGIETECFYGQAVSAEPFRSEQVRAAFVTGAGGLGHFVELTSDLAKSLEFYRGCLGFKTTDYITAPIGPGGTATLTFLHCNRRHHSVALVEMPEPPKRIHHIMLEMSDIDDVGLAFDRRQSAGISLVMELGRHSNDHMFSFYMQTPSGFAFELGWGAIVIDDATWTVRNYDRTSDWGHQHATPH